MGPQGDRLLALQQKLGDLLGAAELAKADFDIAVQQVEPAKASMVQVWNNALRTFQETVDGERDPAIFIQACSTLREAYSQFCADTEGLSNAAQHASMNGHKSTNNLTSLLVDLRKPRCSTKLYRKG